MKKIFIDSSDSLLKETLKKVFLDVGFDCVGVKSKADVIVFDDNQKISVNGIMFEKPVDVFALINAVNNDTNIKFGAGELIFSLKKIVNGEKEVKLTSLEISIVKELVDAGSDGVDVSELVKKIFGRNTDSNVKSLSTHVYNLRKKLSIVFDAQKNIVLENNRYCLVL